METTSNVLPPNPIVPPSLEPGLQVKAHAEAKCRFCSELFTHEKPEGKAALWLRFMTPTVCETCLPILEAEQLAREQDQARKEAAERRAERVKVWAAKLCPPLYQDTDLARLPDKFMFAAASFVYGTRGLAFCGRTGVGKTRAMFQLVHRLYVEEGRRAKYLTSAEFSHRVSRLSSTGMEQLDEFINDLCRVPVLFLDDLGKGRNTERVESELYHVVEQRTANCRPVFFTAQLGGDELAASMGEDRGAAIVRRLGEFCDVVNP